MRCFILFFSALSFTLFSQTSLFNKGEEQKTVPNPMNLGSSWWDYFEESSENFAEKQALFLEKLNLLTGSLSRKNQAQARVIIKHIATGLDIVGKMHKDVHLTASEKVEFLAEYDLEKLEAFAYRLYDLQKDIKQIEKQIEIENSHIEQKQAVLDSKWLFYKKLDSDTEAKLLNGLEVIEKRIYLFIERQRLKESKFSEKQKKLSAENIQKEIEYARAHLVLKEKPEEGKIQDLLDQQRQTSDALRLKLLSKELSPEKTHLLKQRLLISSVFSLIYQTDILRNNILKEFFLVEKEKISKIQEKIKNWQEEINALQHSFYLWKEKSQFYYKTAIKDIETPQNGFYKESSKLAEKAILLIHQLDKNLFVGQFLLDQLKLYVKENRSTFFSSLGIYWYSLKNFFHEHGSWFRESLFNIGEHPITPLALIEFVIVIAISYFLAKWVRRSLQRTSRIYRHVSQAGMYTLSRLIFYVIIILGILIACVFVGIDLTAFAVIIGALSIGIGFSLQPLASNFMAGIIVLLEKNVRVGDFIELDTGDLGSIKEINLRTTLITTLDNLEILIPNSDLITKKFVNWTLSEKIRRARIPFNTALGADKEKVRAVVIEAAKKVAVTIDKIEPDVWLREIGEYYLHFELVVWVNEYVQNLKPCFTSSRYTWAIESALRENNIEIPVPARDVRMRPEKNYQA